MLVVAPLLDTAGHHNLKVADRADLVDRLKSLVMQSYYLNYEEQYGFIIILVVFHRYSNACYQLMMCIDVTYELTSDVKEFAELVPVRKIAKVKFASFKANFGN